MKQFLLSLLIFLTIICLIVIFQNIGVQMQGIWFLFIEFTSQTTAMLGVFMFIALGFITGLTTMAFINKVIADSKDQEQPGSESW